MLYLYEYFIHPVLHQQNHTFHPFTRRLIFMKIMCVCRVLCVSFISHTSCLCYTFGVLCLFLCLFVYVWILLMCWLFGWTMFGMDTNCSRKTLPVHIGTTKLTPNGITNLYSPRKRIQTRRKPLWTNQIINMRTFRVLP